ncbi:MAG: iron-containing alcohol dehydrogenase, partial [Candidatus Hodarchaeota archaeon]
YGNQTPGLNHALGHSFGKIFDVHHGLSCGLFLPYTLAFKAKVSDKWKQLCPIFGIEIENKKRAELMKEFIQKIRDFIHSIDGTTCVKDLKDPIIIKEEYFEKLEKLVDYANNDAVILISHRPINEELCKKIFEYAWDGKDIDF